MCGGRKVTRFRTEHGEYCCACTDPTGKYKFWLCMRTPRSPRQSGPVWHHRLQITDYRPAQWLYVVQRHRHQIFDVLYYCTTYYLLCLENLRCWIKRHWRQLTISLASVFLPLARSTSYEPNRRCLRLFRSTYYGFHPWFLVPSCSSATFHRLFSHITIFNSQIKNQNWCVGT